MKSTKVFYYGFVVVLLATLACNLTQFAGAPGVTNTPAPTQAEATLPASPLAPSAAPQITAPSATQPATQAASVTPLQATATLGPACTVLQDLNMRSGPGTAYRPPIRVLPANTVLVPLGFNPVGIPGGSWVQVKDESQNQIGWVSAGGQFVNCNIDLNGLPSVAVPTPAPPLPPVTTNSTPDGTFPDSFTWQADFNPLYFVRFRVFDTADGGTQDGDGIQKVSFEVLDDQGQSIYSRTENTAGYCIFGGGEPDCNPWVFEDFMYKWKAGGTPVQAGSYKLLVVVTAKSGEVGNWNYDVKLTLP